MLLISMYGHLQTLISIQISENYKLDASISGKTVLYTSQTRPYSFQ